MIQGEGYQSQSFDANDLTIHVHNEAMRHISRSEAPSEDESEIHEINENIYRLLLKNVSRDDPLTPDELRVLRDFRASMSGEQWQRWLTFARSEKKRLVAEAEQQSTQTLSLADAIASHSEDDNDFNYRQESSREEKSNHKLKSVSSTRSTSIDLGESKTIGEPIDPFRRSLSSTLGQPKATSQPAFPPQQPHHHQAARMPAPSVQSSARRSVDINLPRPTHDINELTPQQHHSKPTFMKDDQSHRPLISSGSTYLSSPFAAINRHNFDASQSSVNHTGSEGGVSTNKPASLRAHSAPRLRPTTPSNLTIGQQNSAVSSMKTTAVSAIPSGLNHGLSSTYLQQHQHLQQLPQPPRSPPSLASPPHPTATSTVNGITINRAVPPLTPQSSQRYQNMLSLLLSEKAAETENTKSTNNHRNFHQNLHNKKKSKESDAIEPPSPASALASLVSRTQDHTAHSSNYRHSSKHGQRMQHQHSEQDDDEQQERLREALESAQMGSNRIENACTAARFLINSLSNISQQVDPNTNHSLDKSRGVLQEMLTSLEKSKANFGRIENTVTKTLTFDHDPSHQHAQEHSHQKIFLSANDLYVSGVADEDEEEDDSRGQAMMMNTTEDYLRYPASSSAAALDADQHAETYEDDGDIQSPRSLNSSHVSQNQQPNGYNPRNSLYGSKSRTFHSQFQSPNHQQQASYVPPKQSLMWSPAKGYTERGGGGNGKSVLVVDHHSQERSVAMNSWGLVTRICLHRGSLVKAYEEFPIRVDLEAMSVDVVWRESRVDQLVSTSASHARALSTGRSSLRSNSTTNHFNSDLNNSSASRLASKPTAALKSQQLAQQELYDMEAQRVLRRERFQFDAMYIGLPADKKLQEYVRFRTRRALEQATNLVFLCNACGDRVRGELEGSVNVALGSGGGSGITTNVLIEAFKFIHQHGLSSSSTSAAMNSSNESFIATAGEYSYLKSSVQNSYLSSKMAQENRLSSVSLSAVLIQGNHIVDLLSNQPSPSPSIHTNKKRNHQQQQPTGPRIHRHRAGSSGEVTLSGVTLLELANVMDFERIVGLLLGRRTGIQEAMQGLQALRLVSSPDLQVLQHLPLASYATWSASSLSHLPLHSQSKRLADAVEDEDNRLFDRQDEEDDLLLQFAGGYTPSRTATAPQASAPTDKAATVPESSTMLLSLRIALGGGSGSSRSTLKRVVNVRIVCPCGKDWNQPNYDLSVLAESIGALPHAPPESLLAVSPLTSLLTDVATQPTNFVSVVHINRLETPRRPSSSTTSSTSATLQQQELAQTALHAMRLSCLAR